MQIHFAVCNNGQKAKGRESVGAWLLVHLQARSILFFLLEFSAGLLYDRLTALLLAVEVTQS